MTFQLETDGRSDIVDVTARVEESIPDDVDRGVCTVFVPHTTAGVVVNENESRLRSDLEGALERLIPCGDGYEHDSVDDNADAHLRTMLLGESVSIPVSDGTLDLGTWQSVLFVESDGPRTRSVTVVTARGSSEKARD